MAERFIGLQYPLVSTSHGLLAHSSSTDQIKADLLQLLLTNPGERCMLPTFGTPLRTLIFEQNDITLANQAQQMISNSIATWEPRIVVTGINVTNSIDPAKLNQQDTKDEIEAILFISISFVDPSNISKIEQLVLTVPIGV